MTNREKFKEVFGFYPKDDEEHCLLPEKVCETIKHRCQLCPFLYFWNREYKECFEIKGEFEK